MESEDEDHEEDEEMQLLPPKLSHQRASSDAPSPRTAKPLFGRITSPRQDNLVAHLHVPSTARRGANTTPKARLRHDDSQIQFAAIDSSPLQPEPVESQYLTDRQKEVKERQGLEVAAMFPEIRSSPKSAPRPAEYSLPKLVFKPTQDQAVNPSVDDDTSPTFSLDISMNEFLGSSPTPRSRKRGQHSDDDEPPSSPPFVSSVLPISQNIDPPYASNDYEQVISRGQKDQTNCLAEVHAPNPKDVFYDKDQRAVAAPLVDFDEVALSATPQSHTNAHAMSDSEVFVDAPSEPVGTKDCIESSGREANVAANSFQSEGSSHFSTEDDQVTAQLVSEMERASSQQPHKPESSTPLFTKATSKRKRKGSDGVAPIANKKQKHTLASSDLHEATNAPSSGSMVAACVMINVRKAERSLAIIPHQIKSERCASPSFFASTQAVEETPVAPKGPIGRTKSLRSDQSSSQGEGTPASGKKAVGRPRGSRQSQGRLEQEVNVAPATSSQQRHTRKSGRLNGEPMSSPRTSHTPSQENSRAEPWISLGKTPRRGMFRWRQSSDEDSESGERRPDSAVSSPHVEDVERTIKDNDQAKMVDSAQSPLRSLPGAQTSQHVSYSAASTNLNAEISQSEVTNDAEKQSERPNVEGILQGFKDMLDHIKRGTLGREEEREMVGVLFELVREVHEAGRRHSSLYQQ